MSFVTTPPSLASGTLHSNPRPVFTPRTPPTPCGQLTPPAPPALPLQVQPFASLVGRVSRRCPRLLINRELVGAPDPMLATLGLVDGRAILHGDEMNDRDAFHRVRGAIH